MVSPAPCFHRFLSVLLIFNFLFFCEEFDLSVHQFFWLRHVAALW